MATFSIQVNQLGKKFYQRWVFKNLSFSLEPGEKVAITGSNGSGKSTLMHILAGQTLPTQGNVIYQYQHKQLPRDKWYTLLSWASPAMELNTELSLEEHLSVHFSFKACILDSYQDIVPLIELEQHVHKPLKFFSSGMLQRVKIAQAIFSQSELLLLDEPTSFMDEYYAAQTLSLLQAHSQDRMVILASNIDREHKLYPQKIAL